LLCLVLMNAVEIVWARQRFVRVVDITVA
jgi:hypothetical protein